MKRSKCTEETIIGSLKERQKLERLCRYISRPVVPKKRLSLSPNGNIRYRLKTPYRDGYPVELAHTTRNRG
jgi:hypothetical protein|tara:strand:- start:2800 stop:3012 length:213 start_codon:yes stop_codon:yes gene_type:complete